VFSGLSVANLVGILLTKPNLRILCLRKRSITRLSLLWRSLFWSLAAVFSASVQGFSVMIIVTASSGAASYAPIAAALVIVSPIRVVTAAVTSVLVADLSHTGNGYLQARYKLWLLISGIAVFAAFYGCGLALLWPWINHILYSHNFADLPMTLVVGLAWLAAWIASIYAPLTSYTQAMLNFRRGAYCVFAGALVGFTAVLFLVLFSQPWWSLAGLVAGELVTLSCLCRCVSESLGRGKAHSPTAELDFRAAHARAFKSVSNLAESASNVD
jgi:O-antigen/teichoic acid export membrane protein